MLVVFVWRGRGVFVEFNERNLFSPSITTFLFLIFHQVRGKVLVLVVLVLVPGIRRVRVPVLVLVVYSTTTVGS